MINNIMLKTIITICLILSISSKKCSFPPGAEGFSLNKYEGTWYEIAKFQTAAGAYWEKNCICTNLKAGRENSKFLVHNICRDKTKKNKIVEAVGELIDEDLNNPGHYKQKMFWFVPSIDYTIILQGEFNGEEYSVEYDCNEVFLLGRNYCVHFLSRKPYMSDELLQILIEKVNELGLNSDNLPLEKTNQEGCW